MPHATLHDLGNLAADTLPSHTLPASQKMFDNGGGRDMFCLRCGTEVPDESQFCRKCGQAQSVTSSGAAAAVGPARTPATQPTAEPNAKSNRATISLIVLMLVIV